MIFCAAISPCSVLAAGQETLGRDQDIVLAVDSRWPGNAHGGYLPLRIKLTNMAAPRTLRLVFEELSGSRYDDLPRVAKSVHVEQQATVNFTLSVPMVSSGTEGILRVFDESGEELKGLTVRHSLPEYGGQYPRTSLLVISSENLDDKTLQPFEDAAISESTYTNGLTSGGRYGSSRYGGSVNERDHLVVQPNNLPTNWIDYSGLNIIAADWRDWSTKLSGVEREAILKWVSTGGVLMIYGTGKPVGEVPELNSTLQLPGTAVRDWVPSDPDQFRLTNIITAAELQAGTAGTVTISGAPPHQNQAKTGGWDISPQSFAYRDWSLGRVYVFLNNPFPGLDINWAWWLSSLPKNLSQWPRKTGMNARSGNTEFLNFLIPGVGSVPVFAFLSLITVFTFVIGPLNYYLLKKRRRLSAMVVTVPLIAGVTSLLLFAYSLVADGFSIRSRTHSFTWLDQGRKSSVSLSRLCLYAPFAPSAGLKFSPECAVFPIWPVNGEFDNGNLDWSGNDQRLTSGWFRSQTWTQFETIDVRDERGRFDFTPPANPDAPEISASNGLIWDLDYVAVHVGNGRWYAGENILAGATAQLKQSSPTAMNQRLGDEISKHAWAFPAGTPAMAATPHYSSRGRRGMYYYGIYSDLQTMFSESLLLKYSMSMTAADSPAVEIQDWRDGANQRRMVPHLVASQPHYRAILRKNPNIQTGVKSSVDSESFHLLLGTF